MIRCLLCALATLAAVERAAAQTNEVPLEQRRWFETRSAHFYIYSCAARQDVFALVVQLEQFREAYALLAGAEAVASPPIVVMAFPDLETMKPFLPLHEGRPINLAGFFRRGSDENLIVLALPGTNSASMQMEIIFHEYAHLLFRRSAQHWPTWLNEGMAEYYSTFETAGRVVRIGRPVTAALRSVAKDGIMPLRELFDVTHESPQYNERERQGIFYASSWLLTRFLVAGDQPGYKARFGSFLTLLRQGQLPEQAFTNALGTSLPVVENELRRYLARGDFAPLQLTLSAEVSSPRSVARRELALVEIRFRLGKELLRVDRLEAAELYFQQAQKLAPASPLPWEGLGLLAAERMRPEEAVRCLEEALRRGSISYLVHFIHAREKYRLTADPRGRYSALNSDQAVALRTELKQSIALMPSFGPAHELLGFLEMVQGENLPAAEQQLQLAIQLEPENPSYLLALAQAQSSNRKPGAARRTLEPLLRPHADAELRSRAWELLHQIESDSRVP